MSKLSPKLTAIIAATAAAGVSGAAIAGAADRTSSSSTSTTASAANQRPTGGPGAGETRLTGETKEKVEAAALAKVQGTVVRTETDGGGVYESHIRKSDGTEVEVKVDKDFAVTSIEEARPGGHGGPRGWMHADLAAVAKAIGVTEAKLRSVVEAARPDRSANGAKPDRDAFAAAIAKSLGQTTADVEAVLDATRQAGGGRHGRGDQSQLVSALASKFSVSQEKAQAAVDAAQKAHEAEHQEREAAMYAAIAKALSKDADAVQKAFEANRPSPKPSR